MPLVPQAALKPAGQHQLRRWKADNVLVLSWREVERTRNAEIAAAGTKRLAANG